MTEHKAHWENIYQTKSPAEVSWFQEYPAKSIELIKATGVAKDAQILDAGGGASTLVDHLLKEGYCNLSVLDISAAALARAKGRLGSNAQSVHWIEGDVTEMALPHHRFDVWHDRAVFHFLTEKADRRGYKGTLGAALKQAGHLIMGTFALEGPPRCSGLDVVRYSPESLRVELGPEFRLIESAAETHHTPFETEQKFIYCRFQKSSEK